MSKAQLYETDATKLKQIKEASKAVGKITEQYSAAQIAYSRSEFRTASEIGSSAFFQSSRLVTPSFNGQIKQLVQAAEIEMNDVQALGTLFQVGIEEPFAKLIGVVTSCEAEIRARDDVTKECEKYAEKVRKYEGKDRTGPNLSKLYHAKSSLDESKRRRERLERELSSDWPNIREGFAEVVDPAIAAIARSEHLIVEDQFARLSALYAEMERERLASSTSYAPAAQSPLSPLLASGIDTNGLAPALSQLSSTLSASPLDELISKRIGEMKALAIVE